MISVLAIFLFFGICSAIYWGIWYGTREKLENEDDKSDFLESYYSYLKDLEFNEETKPLNEEFANILEIYKAKGFKRGKVVEVNASLPHNCKKPWKVFSTLKSGTWPINDKEVNIEIYSIIDSDLENLEEYKNFITSDKLK